jgi:hypothetical protein
MRFASSVITRNCPVGEAMWPQKYRPGSFVNLTRRGWLTVIVMQPPGIRQQPLQVGFEAGRKNDGIKPFHPEAEKTTPSGVSFQWRLAP